MIILSISNVRDFTSHLFIKETFDKWLVLEVTLSTHNTFRISGRLNRDYYTNEEAALMNCTDSACWELLRPICFSIIKGNKTPVAMKMVFELPADITSGLLESCAANLSSEDVNGLYINIQYEHGKITLTTGSSLKTFTMDRSLDEAFETYVKHSLYEAGIEYNDDCL